MTRILIGNDFDDDLRPRDGAGWWAQRLVWFAESDDIVVLPVEPDTSFIEYVTSMTGTRRGSVRIIVPPPDDRGTLKLTGRRLAHGRFVRQLDSAIAGRRVAGVLALWPDATVTHLARTLGIEGLVPGFGFFDQGGSTIANSKSAFRAMAAGIGLKIPPGRVCRNEEDAADVIGPLVDAGRAAILKKDYMSGGAGNEIVSPRLVTSPVGARHVVDVATRADVEAYLDKRWSWLTGEGRHQVVVEEYIPDSIACFAEYLINDDGIDLGCHGEMLSAPLATAQIIPAQGLSVDSIAELTREGRRLCEPLAAMGYRGRLSADAIVSPDGDLLFTEYNGRVTGSTHTYGVVGAKVVGPDFARTRVLVERLWPQGWSAPSHAVAVRRLHQAGLAYDRTARKGVVFTGALDRRDDTIMHCVVAADLNEVHEFELGLERLFGGGGR